jgi:hypothetical protein
MDLRLSSLRKGRGIMFILIIVLSTRIVGFSAVGVNSTSQQVSFKTMAGCEAASKQIQDKRYVVSSFCIEGGK